MIFDLLAPPQGPRGRGQKKMRRCTPYSGLEISENRHLLCITKFIGIHGENLIFSRNIKIFTCPAA